MTTYDYEWVAWVSLFHFLILLGSNFRGKNVWAYLHVSSSNFSAGDPENSNSNNVKCYELKYVKKTKQMLLKLWMTCMKRFLLCCLQSYAIPVGKVWGSSQIKPTKFLNSRFQTIKDVYLKYIHFYWIRILGYRTWESHSTSHPSICGQGERQPAMMLCCSPLNPIYRHQQHGKKNQSPAASQKSMLTTEPLTTGWLCTWTTATWGMKIVSNFLLHHCLQLMHHRPQMPATQQDLSQITNDSCFVAKSALSESQVCCLQQHWQVLQHLCLPHHFQNEWPLDLEHHSLLTHLSLLPCLS